MASTLDITSGGRLELGIGAGWNEEECDAFGIELGSMQERFDRFEEGLAVLKSLLTNDRTTFDGTYYKLTDAMNNPKPLQSPLPICIGGTGKTRTLPLAARYATHWNCGWFGRRHLQRVSPGSARRLRARSAATRQRSPAARSCATRATTTRCGARSTTSLRPAPTS